MKKIRTIISENLVYLRKKNGYTQYELAQKINYSDKAVSRWETGESLPDYETLEELSAIYGVPFSYFFQENPNHELSEPILKRADRINAIIVLSIATIWTILTVIFVLYIIMDTKVVWQLFVLGVPLTAALLIALNHTKFHNPTLFIVSYSLFLWSLITTFFCFYITTPFIWLIYVIGVPIQATVILSYYLIYWRK